MTSIEKSHEKSHEKSFVIARNGDIRPVKFDLITDRVVDMTSDVYGKQLTDIDNLINLLLIC